MIYLASNAGTRQFAAWGDFSAAATPIKELIYLRVFCSIREQWQAEESDRFESLFSAASLSWGESKVLLEIAVLLIVPISPTRTARAETVQGVILA